MEKFEYCEQTLQSSSYRSTTIAEALTKLGDDGWMLVCKLNYVTIGDNTYHFTGIFMRKRD